MERLNSDSEREWILIGMAESCAVRGFAATRPEDVCEAAGVPTATFARFFADTEECLGAVMESFVEEAWRQLVESDAAELGWAERLRVGTATLLGLLAERPALTRTALIEAPAAGGRAGTLYGAAEAALLGFLDAGAERAKEGVPASAARGALAGAETLIVGAVLGDETERLPELSTDVVYLLAVAYLGRSEAMRVARGPAGRGHLRAVA